MACLFSLVFLFSSSISCTFSLSSLDGGLVMPMRVRGEVFGHLSSSSYMPSTLPNMHSLVMVVRCGIRPFKLL